MAIPHEPHFFQPLLPGFHTGVSIPIAFFSKHIQGQTNQNTWTLRSDATDRTWEILQEERRLTRGWKEFTEAHDLRVGDIVTFKLEEDMVFHVTPFGPSCCDIQYTHPEAHEPHHQNITGAGARSSYSWDYCFRAEVTDSNVQEDKFDLPVEATGCTALNKQCNTAQLVNIEGDVWTVSLRFSDSGGFYYIRGWRKFCADNKCRIGDLFAFNVVGDGIIPPLIRVYAPSKKCLKILSTWRRKLKCGDIGSSSMAN